MGKKSSEVLQISYEDLVEYLHSNHSVYMQVGHQVYYLTDVNFEAWRAQDTSIRNSKNHFVDCSELVPTVDEFLALPFINGKTIKDVFSHATFYASIKIYFFYLFKIFIIFLTISQVKLKGPFNAGPFLSGKLP